MRKLITWWRGILYRLIYAGAETLDPHQAVRINLIEKPEFRDAFEAFDDQDYSKALEIFENLAEQGDAAAQINVGVLYETSTGVFGSDDVAAQWYRKAAVQGVPEAQFNLAALLAADVMAGQVSIGTNEEEQRLSEAYVWTTLAAAQGHSQASTGVRRLQQHMSPDQIAEAKRRASEWKPTE